MEWLSDNRIKVNPPKRPKKLTATRFATVLGLNPWSTPFEVWCALTRTYEKPFEDTVYTVAGKTIEPKQIAYMKKAYVMDNLRTPTDVYGKDYFKKTYGDFFHDIPIFGGMWDSLLVDENGKPEAVLEFKTTKRSEDWAEDVPEYYALQAALYAYLLGVDTVIMVASFLEEKDYDAPEAFIPSADNTITRDFSVKERYPTFDLMMDKCRAWWEQHIESGISPAYDEKKDADIIKALTTTTADTTDDVAGMVKEAEALKLELDAAALLVADKEKRYKTLTDDIKKHLMGQFKDGDKKVVMNGGSFAWTVSKTQTTDIDKDAMKADGVFEKYATVKEQFRLTTGTI